MPVSVQDFCPIACARGEVFFQKAKIVVAINSKKLGGEKITKAVGRCDLGMITIDNNFFVVIKTTRLNQRATVNLFLVALILQTGIESYSI